MYPAIDMYNKLVYFCLRQKYTFSSIEMQRHTAVLFEKVDALFKGYHNFVDVVSSINENRRSFLKLRADILRSRNDSNFEDPNHTDLKLLEFLNAITIVLRDCMNPANKEDVAELANVLKDYNE